MNKVYKKDKNKVNKNKDKKIWSLRQVSKD